MQGQFTKGGKKKENETGNLDALSPGALNRILP